MFLNTMLGKLVLFYAVYLIFINQIFYQSKPAVPITLGGKLRSALRRTCNLQSVAAVFCALCRAARAPAQSPGLRPMLHPPMRRRRNVRSGRGVQPAAEPTLRTRARLERTDRGPRHSQLHDHGTATAQRGEADVSRSHVHHHKVSQ